MSGSGVQVRVKSIHPNAHFLHCYAHQLNLVIQKSCSQCRSSRIFFNNLSGIPSFFSNSPQRMSVLEEVAHRRIPCSLHLLGGTLKAEQCKLYLTLRLPY